MDMEQSASAVRFLLLCSQPSPSAGRLTAIRRMLDQPLPWEAVARCAHWHDTCSLMHSVLKDLPEYSAVPSAVRGFLEASYRDHVVRNLCIYGELHRTLEIFRHRDIDVLALKGAALAEPLYGDIASRPMGDIDILVRPPDLGHAEEALRALGYTARGRDTRDFYLSNHYHLTYAHEERGVHIELHWNIGQKDKSRISVCDAALIERWFDRAQSVTLADSPARIQAPHDLLFHLCVHFLKHRFPYNGGLVSAGALLQLADIALLLSKPHNEISWDLLYEETEPRKLTGAVGAVLQMALLLRDDTERPKLDERFLRSAGADRTAIAAIWRRLFSHEDAYLQFTAADLRFLHPKALYRLRHLASTLLPRKQRLVRQYQIAPNSVGVYAHYLRRPAEVYRIWQRLRSDPARAHEEAWLRDWLGLDG